MIRLTLKEIENKMNYEFDLSPTESNDDWLRASRLAKDGSKKSLDELKRMENTEMVEVDLSKVVKK